MADPKQLAVVGITVSVDFGDKEYGKGLGSFMNVSAKVPDPDGIPLEQLDDVISNGLDLYFAAWKTLLGTRFATGVIDAATFKQTLQNSELRLDKVRKYLRKGAVTE
jgi:hypothetical protein